MRRRMCALIFFMYFCSEFFEIWKTIHRICWIWKTMFTFFPSTLWPLSWIFKMATIFFWNPAISQLLIILDTWFWCLHIHFRGQGIQWDNSECDTMHTRYSNWGINQTSLLENVFFYNCKEQSMWDVTTIKNINNLYFFEFTDVPWVQRYQIIRFIVEQRTLTVTVIIWFAFVVMRVIVIFALCVANT